MRVEALKAIWASYSGLLPYLITLAGLGLVMLAIAVDFVGLGGEIGFGRKQIHLTIIGGLVLVTGVVTIPWVKERFLFRWIMPSVVYEQPARSVARRMAQILILTVWFGLLLGLSDLYHIADVIFINHGIIGIALPDVVWMAPVAGLWTSGAAGVILCLISWRWPRLVSFLTVVTVLAFLLLLNVVFMILPKAHLAASLVLALGLALVLARLTATRPERLYGLARRSIFALMVIVAGLTAVFLGWDRIEAQRALAALPPAQPDAPNVVFITLDTVRSRSLSLYGYNRPTTPNLERFAEQGVTFDWAISTSPWTLPSHSSMFTGRFPHELSADFDSPLDDAYPILAEVLYGEGYETAGFAANYVFGRAEYGLARGMIHYEDMAVTPIEVVRSSLTVRKLFHDDWLGRFTGNLRGLSRKHAADLNGDFLERLDHRDDKTRPFFVFLNYFDAHEPYWVTPKYALQFTGKRNPKIAFKADTGEGLEYAEELNDSYDGAIAYLDEQLGLLLAELKKRGSLDKTLVVITSDHGEHFGEHQLMSHANSLYLPLLHVPLTMSLPGRIPADERIPQAVSLRDLPATVVDLVNLQSDAVFPGESLARYWESDSAPGEADEEMLLSEVTGQDWVAEWYPVYKGHMKSLVGNTKLYIRNGDGEEELYDIARDPLEENNLLLTEENQPMLGDFRAALKSIPAESVFRRAKAQPAYR